MDTIHQIIVAAHAAGMTASVGGQAPSIHPDHAEQLAPWGINSTSLTADMLDRTRRNIAVAEHRILLESAPTAKRS